MSTMRSAATATLLALSALPAGASIGPAWTRGEIEKPAAVVDHGGWNSLAYSEEQQERLGVDERG
eukprot:CAMPEP_0119541636 /NCGR_PEP_ID=MMETSP1344-20130328/53084_1 /TAXON_ID=236787 /ORGANISM="Florenciella parvula, Strain CCMP2471" /LENGTH=64 /DNA_ID=CAMNT_0007585659 /DNA_START=8 /DNA_END=198 /DNA_ORIENTATION=-